VVHRCKKDVRLDHIPEAAPSFIEDCR
jgi:hypothetical protein